MKMLRLLWMFGFILMYGVKEISSYYSQCFNGYCFSTDRSWNLILTDARAMCIRNGSNLATITSPDLQDDIVIFINNSIINGELTNPYSFLLDAMRIGDTWTWTNGRGLQPALKTGILYEDAHYLTHASIQRSDSTRLTACQSYDNKSFICGYPGDSSTCSRGFYFNNTCYIITNANVTWFEARYRCVQSGGDLAMLDFANTSQDLGVFKEPFMNFNTPYWVGLKRHSWYWENPTEVEFTYTNWGWERPLYYDNVNCACLDSNFQWKWSHCDCAYRQQFICLQTTVAYTTKTTVMTTTPTSTPTSTSSPATATTTTTPTSASSSITTTTRPSTSSSTTATTTTTPTSTSSSTTTTTWPSTSSSTTTTTMTTPTSTSSSTTTSTTTTPTSTSSSTTTTTPTSTSSSMTTTTQTSTPLSVTSTTSSHSSSMLTSLLPNPSSSNSTSSYSFTVDSGDSNDGPNKTTNATAVSNSSPINIPAIAIGIGVGVGVPLVLGLLVIIIIVTARRKKLREAKDERPKLTDHETSLYEETPVSAVKDPTHENAPPKRATNMTRKKPTDSNIYDTVSSEFSLRNNYDNVEDQQRENYLNIAELLRSDQNAVSPHFIRPSPRDTLYGDIVETVF